MSNINKKIRMIGIIILLSGSTVGAATMQSQCSIKAFSQMTEVKSGEWEVSIVKEDQRKKPGDAFLVVQKNTHKVCEVELSSFGVKIYEAQSKSLTFLVEQGDTDYTQVDWIDPVACKVLKVVREFGELKIVQNELIFSGGLDGAGRSKSKRIKLKNNCFP